jgi:sugar phosphate isomerase/epimerase
MKLIVFSKFFKEKTVDELIQLAHEYEFEGYDLCVRPGYPINPDNAASELPAAVKKMQESGLAIPMVTGNFDLLASDHPTAKPILSAMDKAGVRLLKLGYFGFDPLKQDYWEEVARIRNIFSGWQKLGAAYNVKICYHTHSMRCMGLNCSCLMHLLDGFDPKTIGAYIDPGHMVIEGEEFPVGVAMVRQYLSIIGIKDSIVVRQEDHGHGKKLARFVPAGEGMVDWTGVFTELKRVDYNGPISIHCEFEVPPDQFMETFRREVKYFKTLQESFGLSD